VNAQLVALVAEGRPRVEALPVVALEIIVGKPWRDAERVQLHTPSTGEIRQGSAGAIALVLLEETSMIPPLEDYCPECPHCQAAERAEMDAAAARSHTDTSEHVSFGVVDGGLMVSTGSTPCEWCGTDFTGIADAYRFECRDESHIQAGCSNCGACLHASHRKG
jgi:hypothetical protein